MGDERLVYALLLIFIVVAYAMPWHIGPCYNERMIYDNTCDWYGGYFGARYSHILHNITFFWSCGVRFILYRTRWINHVTLTSDCFQLLHNLDILMLLYFTVTCPGCFWLLLPHDDVIKWRHFPRYWPFVRGIHRWPVNSPHKGQWRGALMLSLIWAWIIA